MIKTISYKYVPTKGLDKTLPSYIKKKINQNIIQIPLYKLKERIKYLCKVKYTEITESYT